MAQNAELRMYHHIISLLSQEFFDLFVAPVRGEGSDVVIRLQDKQENPYYIELQILSRTEEFSKPITIPFKGKEKDYFFILYSVGMKKIWLHRADELFELQKQGDQRNSTPYLVNNFNRLKYPHLNLQEYTAKNS